MGPVSGAEASEHGIRRLHYALCLCLCHATSERRRRRRKAPTAAMFELEPAVARRDIFISFGGLCLRAVHSATDGLAARLVMRAVARVAIILCCTPAN